MTAPRIRRLTPDDWPAYREIRLAALAESPSAFGSTLAREQDFTEEIWRSRIENSAVLVAEREDGPVGLVTGLPTTDGGAALLVSMWVAPNARRHGIGDALVQAVIAWARGAGFSWLEVAVTIGNDTAERLYTRCGFTRTDPAEWAPPTPEHATLTMRLELGALR